jgi:hypothetical protein
MNVTIKCLAVLFLIREIMGSNLGPEPGYRIEYFRGIPQSIHENAEIVPGLPRPLPYTSFTIHHLSFNFTL